MPHLSTLDASFLRVETPTAHMHVGWFSKIDVPGKTSGRYAESLIRQIEARLHLAPRFRQCVVDTPLSVAEPRWCDDPRFDVRRHVTVIDEQADSASQLNELANGFLSEQLPRDRPLWALMIVPRAGSRQALVVGKVHHAMVDGLAAVELGMLLFDTGPTTDVAAPVAWEPAPDAGPMKLLLDSFADSALEQFRTARRVATLGLAPGQGLRVADNLRRAAFSLAGDALNPAPSSLLNVDIGPTRKLVRHRTSLGRLVAIKQRHGVTLNDVVLGVSAGALRRLMLQHGDEAQDLRVMVPVSVRGVGDSPGQGNRITFAFIELPVREPSAAARLAQIRSRTVELKQSGRVAGTEMLLHSVGALPEPFKRAAARLAASPRLYNLTISNVPGPRIPLYAAGGRVRSIYPVIPIPDEHALSLGVLTYDGSMHFAAYADPDALPRLGRLPTMIDDAIEELDGAHARTLEPPPARASTHPVDGLSAEAAAPAGDTP
jgi:diacylglycerol O-acyltransferase